MDKRIVYGVAILLAIIAVASAFYFKKPTAYNQTTPSTSSQTLSADQYLIEGFPLDNHITFFGPNNTLKDIGYLANDAGNSEWDLWSAARILTELERITPYKIDDASTPSATTLWSSQQVANAIASGPSGVVIDDATTTSNLTWSSQNIDNKIKNVINDSQTSPTQTWSSQQISAALAATPGTTVNIIDDVATAPITTWSSTKIDSLLNTVPALDDSATSSTSTWSSQKVSAMLANSLQPISPSTVGDIPIITATGELADSGYKIDDTVTSMTSLWSSNAISNAISSKMSAVAGTAPNEIALFDGTGGLAGSNLSVQDTAPPNANVLWSSDKTTAIVAAKQNLVSGAVAGDVAFFDSQGQVTDKGMTVDDTLSPSPTVLWTSKQISNEMGKKQMLVGTAVANHLATFDASGQVVDSGSLVDDGAPPSTSVVWSSAKTTAAISGKQNVVTSAVAENLASFDSSGQVKDSFFSIKDSSTASPSVLWSSSAIETKLAPKQNLVPSAVSGNLASFDSLGQVADSGAIFSDSLPAANNVIWSSQKIASSQTTVVPSAPGNLASLDAAGKVTDAGKRVDDLLGPDPAIVWTSSKVQDLVTSLPVQKLGQSGTGKFLIFDSAGQSIQSDIGLNDSTTSPSTIWSSQKTIDAMQLKVSPAVAGHAAVLDSMGQVVDGGYALNDSSAPDPNVLWSSTKLKSITNNKQDFIANPVSGNFVSSDGRGQTIMTPYTLDDTATGPTVLWTSAKIAASTASGTAGNLPVIASSGSGLTDSGLKIDDAAPAASNVLWSSQKVQSVASVGNVNDSVISPSSTWSSQQSALAIQNMSSTKMDLVPTAPISSIARFSTGGQVESSGFVIDDTALSASALWSSLKTDATYQKLVSEATAGKIPILNSQGQIVQSQYSFDDGMVSRNTIQSSQQTSDNFVGRKTGVVAAGSWLLFEGIRFGLSNTGLSIQTEGMPGQTGIWSYNTCMRIAGPGTYIATVSQFNASDSTVVKCTPSWNVVSGDMIHSIIRVNEKEKMYRVTAIFSGTYLLNNYIVVEKLM
jgi:hypothetical protein